jgi:hypothetical protein
MHTTLVTAHDYSELSMIHTTRRLYQRSTTGITPAQKQDLVGGYNMPK